MLTQIRENLFVGDDSAGVYFEAERDTPIVIVDLTEWKLDLEPIERNIGKITDLLSVIRSSVLKGYPTLVHCHGGIDRSPFIMACYLYWYENIPSWEAYEEIKKLHPLTIVHDYWMSVFTLK